MQINSSNTPSSVNHRNSHTLNMLRVAQFHPTSMMFILILKILCIGFGDVQMFYLMVNPHGTSSLKCLKENIGLVTSYNLFVLVIAKHYGLVCC